MKGIKLLAASSLLVMAAGAVAQSPPPYGAPIGVEAANKAVSAAIAEAKKNNWNVAIAVVDSGGHLVAFQRLDGTQYQSALVAQDKARSAVGFKRPTKVFADGVAGGRVALLGLNGAVPLDGGQLIVVDGKIVGGIGVSGVTSQQDDQIAMAGVSALK